MKKLIVAVVLLAALTQWEPARYFCIGCYESLMDREEVIHLSGE